MKNGAAQTKHKQKKEAVTGIYGSDGAIDLVFLEKVSHAIDTGDKAFLLKNVVSRHISEQGDLISALQAEERRRLIVLLGDEFDFSALTEVDEAIRLEIMEALPPEQIADGVQEMESDDAVFLLEDLDDTEQQQILAHLPFKEQAKLRRSLEFPEDSAGRRMQTEFVAVPPFWTIGQVIDYMRDDDDLPDHFSRIFVVDPTFRLVGAIDLDRLLRTRRPVRVDAIMHDNRYVIPATMDQEEAAQIFEQYDLLSAAVVDANEHLLGVLTIDDVVDVIQEEADEDIRHLGGVGDEELSDSVPEIVRSRAPWLLVNMITSCISASVIGLFGATIEQMVALAMLMPIVASTGGNAATQTMTVTVRALATRTIDIYNAARVIRREVTIGLFNGCLFASMMGLVAGLWFWRADIGMIIACAMVINMLVAAMAGILVPLLLNRFGADPAIASSVFVTMTTDITGFFSFLGLATWWFHLSP